MRHGGSASGISVSGRDHSNVKVSACGKFEPSQLACIVHSLPLVVTKDLSKNDDEGIEN